MRRAFTLIESISVIALMALIIAGGVTIWGLSREGTQRQQTQTQLRTLAAEIEAIKTKTGSYPNSSLPSNLSATDAWGNSITYADIKPLGDPEYFTLTSPGKDPNVSAPAGTNCTIVYDSSKE